MFYAPSPDGLREFSIYPEFLVFYIKSPEMLDIANAAWQIGSILGPVLTGMGLSMHLAVPLFLIFIAALILWVPFLIVLEHAIPIEINRVLK